MHSTTSSSLTENWRGSLSVDHYSTSYYSVHSFKKEAHRNITYRDLHCKLNVEYKEKIR